MIPAVLFGALAFGASLALAARAPSRGTGRDVVFNRDPSRLHRLRLETSTRWLDALRSRGATQKQVLDEVGRRVAAMGFRPVLLVMQDPTNSEIFSVLARGHGAPTDGVLALVGAEPVEEPGPASRLASPSPDPGLTTAELAAVQTALTTEMNPRHLTGFSETLKPLYPVAASLLYAKARILEEGPGADPERTFGAFASGAKTLPNPSAALSTISTLLAEVGAPVRRSFVYGLPTDAEVLRANQLLSAAVAAARAEGVPADLIAGEVRRAVSYATEESAEGMATMPPAFRALGEVLVLPNPEGPRIANRALLNAILPPTGEEGFVSPSALQLAEAEMKPVTAGVDTMREVPLLVQEIRTKSDARDPQGMRARAMVEKAERAIERRRWADWYRIG